MMDDSSFQLNSLSALSSQPHYPPQHQQQQPSNRRYQDGPQESNTLPPINGLSMPFSMYGANNAPHNGTHNGSMLSGTAPNSMPQTPITPHSTPGTSSAPPPETSSFAQNLQHGRTLHPPPNYQTGSLNYQSSQPLSAAPVTSLAPTQQFGGPLSSRPNDILPRMPHQYSQHPLLGQQNSLGKQQEPEPTHVVGQQGRRGILPSAPGRAAPTSGKTPIPTKDADGKFPCPHCTKTYLHAKHLKRHMLRHTGDRPYQCKLCKDTFSRSDILKRHFQKCSIRRGVTGDTNHLEGSRNHLQKNRLSNGSMGEQHSYLNAVAPPNAAFDPSLTNHLMNSLPGFVADQPYGDGMPSMSNRSSRSNSLLRPSNGMADNRRSMNGLEHLTQGGSRFDEHQDFSNPSTLAGMATGMPAYSMPPTSNGYGYQNAVTAGDPNGSHQVRSAGDSNGMFKQEQDIGWASNFQGNGTDNYMFSAGPVGGGGRSMKPEPDLLSANPGNAQAGLYSNLYSNSSHFTGNQAFDGWNLGDPLFDNKAAALVAFCFANGAPNSYNEIEVHGRLREILTADNIKRYIRLFQNFQGHWPIIHMPTFSTLNANNGLLLAMVTIGAVYSEDLGLHEVRWLMELSKFAVDRTSRIFNIAKSETEDSSLRIQPGPYDIEEIQALILLQVTFIWHGNKQQRRKARDELWLLAKIARQSGLLYPIPDGQPGSSILHRSRQALGVGEVALLNWQSWVDQEKHSRAMFLIYLMDCALAIFFNCPPNFDASELRLQLPADDGAWEARDQAAWLDSLGYHGKPAQDETNQTGSRQAFQPEFNKCIQTLLSPKLDLKPNSTNVYSKFILIHALLVKIVSPAVNLTGLGGMPSGASTPLSQYDWVSAIGPQGPGSRPDSGRATPTESFIQHHQGQENQRHFGTLLLALDKWKRAWDFDIDYQYPPTGSPTGRSSVRRIGFCRDAIHFYFLGKQFLTNGRSLSLQGDPDKRMAVVMGVLKQIRTFVASQGDMHGSELGSIVDIDDSYGMDGVDDLTLDMKLLFAPLPLETQSVDENGGQLGINALMQQQ